jgi:recombination protein RecT
VATQLAVAKKDITNVINSAEYQERIGSMLPPDVDRKRFTAVALRAVQENPDLLQADKTSLLLACQRAASDGLLPDKREGAMVVRGGKVAWTPMIAGLRKILAKYGYDVRAEIVYENDAFDYELGDTPSLSHKPAPLGVDRGKMIGAYAVVTHLDSGAKYREVMNMAELDAVKAMGAKGGPWSGAFKNEMYRKTVARRCLKQVPLRDAQQLNDVLERDNENFELPAKAGPTPAAQAIQAAARGEAPANDEPVDEVDYDEVQTSDDDGDPLG